jgi:zinc protease
VKLTLKNGLRVILEENHAAPVVAMQAWVGVGSADEPERLAGIAHVFEHMLFKGTKKRGVGQIAREIEAAGGDINAWTSFDETVYHLVLAAPFFDTGLDILSDALINSSFDPGELERERKVVLEEIKQGQDSPERVASQMLFSAAYKAHPYGRAVIGNEATVSALTRDQMLAFFQRFYVASNLTLVIVGDFEAAAAKEKIATAFAKMRKGEPPPDRPAEPAQRAPRTVAVARDVRETQMQLSFHTPAITHEDVAALDLLAVILGQDESSRLNLQVARNRQLVTGAYSYMFTSRDNGMLVVGASMPPGRIDEPARAILDEVLRLAREEVSPEELTKARNILESDIVYDKETVQGYARKLGFFACIAGEPEFEDRYFERVRALTPTDIRAAARRYLRVDNLTSATLVPDAAGGGGAASKKASLTPAKLTARLEAVWTAAEARADRRFAAAPAPPVDEVVRVVLPSGVRLVILRDATVPVVSLQGVWTGGLRNEDARSNGITNLLAAILPRGTKSRSAEQIMAEVEGMAGGLSGFSGRNGFGVRAEFLSKHWERGVELFADCIRNPSFSEQELEHERRVILDDIRAQEDNLGHMAFHLFQSTLWKKHPYRLDTLGTADSVAALTRRRLVDHYRRYYGLAGLTIAVVGDVDTARLVAKLQSLLGEAPSGSVDAPVVAPEPAREEPVEVFRFLAKEQAHIVLGYPGTTLRDPDRFPLEVLSQILSGQGGRLFVELRERRALAYRVSAGSVEGIDPGYFAVYLACSPENLEPAVAAIRAELARLLADGVTAEEVERARKFLIGAHAIGLQRKSAIAGALAFHEAYGQGWREYRQYGDVIQKVSVADVQRVARKYIDARREVVAVVKPSGDAPAVSGKVGRADVKAAAAPAPMVKAAGVGRADAP